MRVEHFLRDTAQRLGDKTALIAGATRLSFRELDEMSDRLAAGLLAQGVQRHDRVLVFLDNCWEAAVAIFAILKAGAVFSPVNASTKADRLAYIAQNCGARAVIALPRLAGVLAEAAQLGAQFDLQVLTAPAAQLPDAVLLSTLLAATDPLPPRVGIDQDLALLIYTSGSTGRPKGVMMSHANIDAATLSVLDYLDNTEH
ncbi:MAG TPA: AMP-binding protein, partial [Devosia sp.]|nr:AMP-binding protein [Devosia sp.]